MTSRRRVGAARVVAAVLVLLVTFGGCADSSGRSDSTSVDDGAASEAPRDCGDEPDPVRLVPEVLGERPHDPTAFTQGLLLVDGTLYESTGLEGESSVRAVDPLSGVVVRRGELDPSSFGEGLTTVGDDRLVQLTWKEGRALLWDRADLRRVGELAYDGEGWGITTLDDDRLVMSDGSDSLTVRGPDDFSTQDRWEVVRSDGAVDRLNELEWDGRRIWANRWQTDEIVRIDPRCHRVDAVVDASALTERAASVAASEGSGSIDVLNGIAHEPGTDRFLVTGKRWPVLFEVRFVPEPAP